MQNFRYSTVRVIKENVRCPYHRRRQIEKWHSAIFSLIPAQLVVLPCLKKIYAKMLYYNISTKYLHSRKSDLLFYMWHVAEAVLAQSNYYVIYMHVGAAAVEQKSSVKTRMLFHWSVEVEYILFIDSCDGLINTQTVSRLQCTLVWNYSNFTITI